MYKYDPEKNIKENLESFFENNNLTKEQQKEIENLVAQSWVNGSSEINKIHKKQFRSKFFTECVTLNNGLPEIDLTPHDLFVWIEKNII